MRLAQWHRYAALGGGGSPSPTAAVWTDYLAEILHRGADLSGERFSYSNLAIGAEGISEQASRAARYGADLVSLTVGAGALTLGGAQPAVVAERVERAVGLLRDSGCDVLLVTLFDPRHSPALEPVRGQAAAFTAELWRIAREHDTFTMDLWRARGFEHPSLWLTPRRILTATGHRRLARLAAHSLRLGYYETDSLPLEPVPDHRGRSALPPTGVLPRG